MADPRTWTYERMRPGAVLGSARFAVDDAFVSRWLKLYAGEADTRPHLPPGMAMLVVMRGYAEAVAPRPAGNVHAGQRLTIHRAPRVGEALTTTVVCRDKVLRKGRRWVHLDVATAAGNGELCYEGVITTVWAR